MAHAYGHSVCLTEENVIYSKTTVSFCFFFNLDIFNLDTQIKNSQSL